MPAARRAHPLFIIHRRLNRFLPEFPVAYRAGKPADILIQVSVRGTFWWKMANFGKRRERGWRPAGIRKYQLNYFFVRIQGAMNTLTHNADAFAAWLTAEDRRAFPGTVSDTE